MDLSGSKNQELDQKVEPVDVVSGSDVQTTQPEIYIDPQAEASVLRKFDRIILPQCFIFLVLNYLDRSNIGFVTCPAPPALHADITRQRQSLRLRR